MPIQPRLTATSIVHRMAVVAAVAAAFVLAAAVSGRVVTSAERWAGAVPSTIPTRAWFADPRLADRGFEPGDEVTIVVVPSTDGRIQVVQHCGAFIDARSFIGTGGQPLRVHLFVPERCAGRWMTLGVGGTVAPLQAWVR